MATTAPGTRLAAISRAKKLSSRAKPCLEKPASSGFVSGSGAARAVPNVMTAAAAAIMAIVFFIASSQASSLCEWLARRLDHDRAGAKSSAHPACLGRTGDAGTLVSFADVPERIEAVAVGRIGER